ncbi:MAG TPA: phenylalanine--tRNA ligase subunit beta [Clostridiaceae bacterium]|nr:phenylalanine--tRNA ligase subunit beta [Clostridiaceae bacterium]
MKASLNWIRTYADLPQDITAEQLAHDLTMQTVEVEEITNPADLVEGVVIGRVVTVRQHPQADRLVVCDVDIGQGTTSQIVCGGSNLYENEIVVVAPPGVKVRWHGEGERVELSAAKVRGVVSYGMICAAGELDLEGLFPPSEDEEAEIVDLTELFPDAIPGQPVADVLGLDDLIIDINNKSLTNRPDLWGHYGLARELCAIYGGTLHPFPSIEIPEGTSDYSVEIVDEDRCFRYDAVVFEGIELRDAPFSMRKLIWSVGMRPINVIVDITNYVMLATGQPTHAFDESHVSNGIRVRTAHEGEQLELLDGRHLTLSPTDLLICDGADKAIGLAGIMGGAHDSILPETKDIVLEVANFEAISLRRTASRHHLRTEASIRFEKAINTQRCDLALGLTYQLMAELQPTARIVAAGTHRVRETEAIEIPVSLHFLNVRSGHTITADDAINALEPLGFDVTYDGDDTLNVSVPSWRATGDVDIKDDILEEVCRMIGYENFEYKPPVITLDKPIRQLAKESERAIREFLAFRAGLQEIYTYPWVSDAFINIAGDHTDTLIKLASPPSPDRSYLRGSLIANVLEASVLNSRYYETFGLFELTQVFSQGAVSPSIEEEKLPRQERHLAIALAGVLPFLLFRRLKGILAQLPRFGRFEGWEFKQSGDKMPWADRNAWLKIVNDEGDELGSLGLLSPKATEESGLRIPCLALAEINIEKLVPLQSRDNLYRRLPQFPLVEQDLSIVIDEDVSWAQIYEAVANLVHDAKFVEEYRGEQVPKGKKSLMFSFRLGSDTGTLTAEEIEKLRNRLIKKLRYTLGAEMR